MRLLAGKVAIHVVPHLCPLNIAPFDFNQSAALIERASRITRGWIEQGGLANEASPDIFRHDHGDPMGGSPVTDGGHDLVS